MRLQYLQQLVELQHQHWVAVACECSSCNSCSMQLQYLQQAAKVALSYRCRICSMEAQRRAPKWSCNGMRLQQLQQLVELQYHHGVAAACKYSSCNSCSMHLQYLHEAAKVALLCRCRGCSMQVQRRAPKGGCNSRRLQQLKKLQQL